MTGEIGMLLKIIHDVGFPIVVAVWFMLRNDRRLDKVVECQRKILVAIEKISNDVREK